MHSSTQFHDHSIAGVMLRALALNMDHRGILSEIYRKQWVNGPIPVQINVVHSHAGVLRGIHVHVRHYDYLTLLDGTMQVCLGDLRKSSPTFGQWYVIALDALEPRALIIPPGVAHGFYSPLGATHLYGMSEYWRPEEELGCHWTDSLPASNWVCRHDPVLSERDARLGSLTNLLSDLEQYQALFR